MDIEKLKYTPASPLDTFKCDIDGLDARKYSLLNGIPQLEKVTTSPAGLKIERVEQGNGVSMEVSPATVLDKPLQLINVRNGNGTTAITYTNTLKLGSKAKAQMIICDHTLSADKFVTQSSFNIDLEEGAQLDVLVMQNEHNFSQHHSEFNVQQASDSNFHVSVITLHGGHIENFIDIKLLGERASSTVQGLFLTDAEQYIVTDVQMQHLAPNCFSNQLFKGVLKNKAVGHFHGRILVAKDAQKTEAYQSNHNLLLDRTAKIYTQPQLEIYADDVKCSHGATVGRLNNEVFFYLRSRGIGRQEALLLQQLGFANDVLDKITIAPLRERIAELVEKRLRGELSHCENCSLHCC